jgi:hypothetical protein
MNLVENEIPHHAEKLSKSHGKSFEISSTQEKEVRQDPVAGIFALGMSEFQTKQQIKTNACHEFIQLAQGKIIIVPGQNVVRTII